MSDENEDCSKIIKRSTDSEDNKNIENIENIDNFEINENSENNKYNKFDQNNNSDYYWLKDEIYENECDQTTMSPIVMELAHNIYSEMESIIRIHGNEVGELFTPIVVQLLEKLDVQCKTLEKSDQKLDKYNCEIRQLRKNMKREKSFRIDAESVKFIKFNVFKEYVTIRR